MLGRLFNNNRSNDHLASKPPYYPGPSNSLSTTTTNSSNTSTATTVVGSQPSQQSQPLPLSLSIPATNLSNPELSHFTTEDSYSRTILYGTPNHLQSVNLETNSFRLLIVQDKGELLMKNNYKTHYDSLLDPHFTKPSTLSSTSINNTCNNTKQNNSNKHDIKELVEVMFGNPIRHDLNKSDHIKIHILSPLKTAAAKSNTSPTSSVFISKHFHVSKKKTFAIGIIIPVPLAHISTALLSNWSIINSYLNLFKGIFIENHLQTSDKCSSTAVCPPNFLDITIFFKTFIKSLKYLATVPRVLPGLTKFDSVLENWCFEVNNWIEVKDGAKLGFCGTKFLTTLLTIVQELKYGLVNKSTNKESVRMVIMASNPMVAQKLIFIISELLPFDLEFKQQDYQEDDTLSSLETGNENQNENENGQVGVPVTNNKNNENKKEGETSEKRLTPPTPSVIKKGWEIPTTPSRSVATPSFMTPSRSSVIQPTSMSNSSSMAYLSSSLSSSSTTFSSSLSRGLQLLQNWKGGNGQDSMGSMSNGQPFNTMNSSSSSTSSHSYKTPSPNNEYDDYPWPSNNISAIAHPNYTLSSSFNNNNPNNLPNHHLQRTNSSYDLTCGLSNIPKSFKRLAIPKVPHIDRTATTLYKIGEAQKSSTQLFNISRKDCYKLMSNKNLSYSYNYERDNLKNVSILEIPFDDDEDEDEEEQEKEVTIGDDTTTSSTVGNEAASKHHNNSDHIQHTLPLICGYVHEYIPDFQIQACPISQDLDSKIISSMKNDLEGHEGSKTILVSLRAREIKELTLARAPGQLHHRANVRKLYANSRPGAVDKASWSKIENLLDNVTKIFRSEEDEKEFAEIGKLLKSL